MIKNKLSGLLRWVTKGSVKFAAVVMLLMFSQTASAATLIGYWNFDETSGTVAADNTGFGSDGTLMGDATFAPGQGLNGSVAVHIGSTGYVTTGDNNFAFGSFNAFSVQTWIKTAPGNITSTVSVSDAIQNGAAGYFLGLNNPGDGVGPGGISHAHVYQSIGPTTPPSSIVVNDGQWHQIVGVYGSSTISLYVDGQFQSAVARNALVGAGLTPFLIGGITSESGTPTNSFSGLIDNAAIWDGALTGGEVQAEFAQGGTQTTPLPAALPLFAGGLGVISLLARRRKRKAAATFAAA